MPVAVTGYRVSMASITLIEDDERIARAVVRGLQSQGHQVTGCSTALEGLAHIIEVEPDVVILDLGLPDVDGAEALRMLRAVSAVPVIVATARDEEAEIVRVLDQGADDYLVKPFSTAQLDARIRAVLRRGSRSVSPSIVEVEELRIDVRARAAWLRGQALALSRKEFDLLVYLAEHAGMVVSKQELLREVWRQPRAGGDNTVDVHLSWLRRKLGETAAEPRLLHTVRGVGVKLAPPTT
jgi:DNA-binding response OmpR family regulator